MNYISWVILDYGSRTMFSLRVLLKKIRDFQEGPELSDYLKWEKNLLDIR